MLARGLILAVTLLWSSSPALADDWLILTNFHLIDGTDVESRHVDAMTVRQGKIEAIGETSAIAAEPLEQVTRIGLDGAWVIPGLIDTHIHSARYPDAMQHAQQILEDGLRGGVTSVRDMGGDARALAEIQRALLNREWDGPTVRFAGMYGGPSLFEDERIAELSPGYPVGESPWTQAVTEETNLSLAIAATRGAGAGGIKVYGNLDATLASKIISEASSQGLLSWAHATVFPAGPLELVEAGVSSLSHAPYLVWAAVDEIPDDYGARIAGPWTEIPADHPRLRDLYAAMAERDVSLDATLYIYSAIPRVLPPGESEWAAEALDWGAQAVRAAHEAGVPITTGTDWFEGDPGELPHTHNEMALLVELSGLTPMQAIVAATHNGARALGILSERGTIEVGKAADLVVLQKNPLEDINNTRAIRMVFKDGTLVFP